MLQRGGSWCALGSGAHCASVVAVAALYAGSQHVCGPVFVTAAVQLGSRDG
jgi:hypothetical protein